MIRVLLPMVRRGLPGAFPVLLSADGLFPSGGAMAAGTPAEEARIAKLEKLSPDMAKRTEVLLAQLKAKFSPLTIQRSQSTHTTP